MLKQRLLDIAAVAEGLARDGLGGQAIADYVAIAVEHLAAGHGLGAPTGCVECIAACTERFGAAFFGNERYAGEGRAGRIPAGEGT